LPQHIESLAVTIGNEALQSRNMLAALVYMPFDMAQQKQFVRLGRTSARGV
jgi:hypothetical protein